MEADKIESINGAYVQHGRASDRVYVMKIDATVDRKTVIKAIEALAMRHHYGKIFVKAHLSDEATFLDAGYRREGFVEGLFDGKEDGVFLCRYPDVSRMTDPRQDVIVDVLTTAKSRATEPFVKSKAPFSIAKATPHDATEMATLYRQVFASYPFPIVDADYLRATMLSHIVYFVARDEMGSVVAASSIEMDTAAKNAEMTDFATLPVCRGKKIALHLLAAMEREAPSLGIKTVFTIARAMSYGMNITFARLGYTFGGTLVNNTQISGAIESMNIWYKRVT
jgi:putative beta-lysine N-acetyltransferase